MKFGFFHRMLAERIAWRLNTESIIEMDQIEEPIVDGQFERISGILYSVCQVDDLASVQAEIGSEWACEDLDQFFESKDLSEGEFRRLGIRLVTDVIVARLLAISVQGGARADALAEDLRPRFEETFGTVGPRSPLALLEQRDFSTVSQRKKLQKTFNAFRPDIAKHLWGVSRGDFVALGDWSIAVSEDEARYRNFLTSLGSESTTWQRLRRLLAQSAQGAGSKAIEFAEERGRSDAQGDEPDRLPATGQGSIARMDIKLWGGFSTSSRRELNRVLHSRRSHPKDVSHAAWSLARWYAFNDERERALDCISLARNTNAWRAKRANLFALELECLLALGRMEEAGELVDCISNEELVSNHLEARLGIANWHLARGHEAGWFDIVNQMFSAAGLSSIVKRNEAEPLSIANLASELAERIEKGPTVSVIMPVFNAADTIAFALRSVQEQTWRNLQVIVVDDCSTDSTGKIVAQIADTDPRVEYVRLKRNAGAYKARNAGLMASNGHYVTVHDGDDWSHPQKIETQVRYLEEHSQVMAAYFNWVRVSRSLAFVGSWRPGGEILTDDLASMMYRREVFGALGQWHGVLAGADTEFQWRLASIYGENAFTRLLSGTPLSLALHHTASLTRIGPTHARTILHGVRRQYREAAQWWHETLKDAEVRNKALPWGGKRALPFPTPKRLLSKNVAPAHYDLVVVMDFNVSGGAFVSTMNYVRAAISAKKKVGVMQWRRYDLDPKKPLNPIIFEMAHKRLIEIISCEQEVSAELVLVGYPVILQHLIDTPPIFDAKAVAIVVNQMASRCFSGNDVQYDPLVVAKHAEVVFGKEPVWIPISGLVRELVEADERYVRIHHEDWTPLIDLKEYTLRPVPEDAGTRPPIVGRHCRDHYTKWPSDPLGLARAYGVATSFEMRFLGGADKALDVLGFKPDNWTIQKFNAQPVIDFLSGLDFFVHFPNEDYIEEFGRSVLEAMAIGVPVILPHVFQKTFGEAVLYAEAEDVPYVVNWIWSDPAEYARRVRIGRDFAERIGGYGELVGRLQRLSAPEMTEARQDESALV